MRRYLAAVCVAVLACQLLPARGTAGTWLGGVKYWSTVWDSGILDWLEEDIAISFRENRLPFDADRSPGEGYLAGPLVGYQSDGGKWSVSVAPMVLSSFTQDWEGSAGSMDLDGDAKLDRFDIDVAVNYNITDNYKLFAGLKYQDMELDFDLTYDTVMGTRTDTFFVEARALIPTAGAGGVHALGPDLVAGGQIGILYSIQDMTITNDAGEKDDIFPHPGLGFNTEVNLTYRPANELLLQVGYRYQVFQIKARGPGREEIVESFDITQGATLTVVYVF